MESLIGQRFGKLLVTEEGGRNTHGSRMWHCACDCGGSKEANTTKLKSGRVKSCGCLVKPSGNELEEGMAAARALYAEYRHGAKRRGYAFELTFVQFLELTSKPCAYCKEEPKQVQKRKRAGANGDYVYNGIDRVDNTLGYLWENCAPCCGDCNRDKGRLGDRRFIALINRLNKPLVRA